jgi:hypothetical protein
VRTLGIERISKRRVSQMAKELDHQVEASRLVTHECAVLRNIRRVPSSDSMALYVVRPGGFLDPNLLEHEGKRSVGALDEVFASSSGGPVTERVCAANDVPRRGYQIVQVQVPLM